jgi:hypothetical protein
MKNNHLLNQFMLIQCCLDFFFLHIYAQYNMEVPEKQGIQILFLKSSHTKVEG